MICTYDTDCRCWFTDDGNTVHMPCTDLAIVGFHIYTRTEVPGRTRTYTLEPCDSDSLYALMTRGLGFRSSYDFTGNWADAIHWLNSLVLSDVKTHREDFLIDLDIIHDLRSTDVGLVTYLLGLRECGVDGLSFIRSRSQSDYSRILLILIDPNGNTEISTMYKLEED